MNINETTKTRKNSVAFTTLIIGGVALFLGGLLSLFPAQKQYYPIGLSTKGEDEDAGALGMAQFFFNARKNVKTNQMDYQSMLAADIADRAMTTARKTHSTITDSTFHWTSMGPTNTGGRTRAILIDNQDPSHQTIFAGGITGGIWKSTNAGASWDNASATISYSLDDTLSNMNICCIAQDSKGALYIGTGEGFTEGGGSEFSSGELGGGIFKSTDDGAHWRLLASTKPAQTNNSGIAWAYVNRIAIRPDSFQVIYAATSTGLMVSHDSGTIWNTAIKAPSTKLSGNTLDVKISADGSVVVACESGDGWYCYPKLGNSNVFTEMKTTGAGKLQTGNQRIEFAISPTDANRIYASVINGFDPTSGFGGDTKSGIFMTPNAVSSGSGGYWYDIGPGGSVAFDPYTEPSVTVYDQATYDNAIGVPPANEAQVLVGGTTLWEWSGANNTDTIGAWEKISHYNPYTNGDPLWIHADEHAIVFDVNNPQTVYIGCDGGLFKSTNMYINPSGPSTPSSIAALNIYPINRNYNVTQYYTVSYSPMVNYVNVSNNNTSMVEGLGLGGGTQDNGSPYVNGLGTPHYPNDATDLSGGDGAGSVVSQLNPNIAYFCSDYGSLEREGNLGTLSFPTSAYTKVIGNCKGADIDSVAGLGGACFVFPVALYENPYDTLNHDSVQFIASTTYTVGTIVYPLSNNSGIPYPYKLPVALAPGDTLNVPDRVVSRLAVGFAPGGIWINGQGASSNNVVWMPIGGVDSKPDAFSDGSTVHALAWTNDGNTLFAGCEDGGLYRFSNINAIIANNYCSGALWYSTTSSRNNPTGNTTIRCINLIDSATGLSTLSGRDILSIASDPKDTNNILVTAGSYGATSYVYFCSNATAARPAFTVAQGNLPDMPVYGCVLDIIDQNGNSIPNSAMIATEHGIYTSTNINAGGATKWVKNSTGLPNVMTLAIKQQTWPAWLCNNAGVIYVGTHGRGLWTSSNEYQPTAVQNIATPQVAENNLLVYPNPMSNQGNIQFDLGSDDNVTVIIYDMQGHEVKTLNMGTQTKGSHLITFATDDLRSGTYFASLTGNNSRKVSKFVVFK